jgi:DNA-binding NtrC family response regulator
MHAKTATVLVTNAAVRDRILAIFAEHDCRALSQRVSSRALSQELRDVDIVVVECSSDKAHPGIHLARQLRDKNRRLRLIIVAERSSEELAIEALRLRADEYVTHPVDFARLSAAIVRCGADDSHADAPASTESIEPAIIGEAASILAVKGSIPRIAKTSCNVLIFGETGTGKEMIAQQIHRRSDRRHRPFVCINCAAIPESLVESELFGHERGAFTGAVSTHPGKLAQAEGGTVFFDEIGDMSVSAQAKILRAIESREIYPLGGRRSVPLDIRIIAATNRNLEIMTRDDRFRADLFFRLNVARICLPPLRERSSDIPLLVEYLLPQYNRTFGSNLQRLGKAVLSEMMSYSWPGNVRELKNVLEVIFLNLAPRTATLERLPQQVYDTWQTVKVLPADERDRVVRALLETHWNISEAARKMHWSRMTMYRKLAKYDLRSLRHITPEQRPVAADDSV